MPNSNKKEVQIREKTELDEQIKIIHMIVWSACLYMMFLVIAAFFES